MKHFFKEALAFAVKKAKSDQQVKEITTNFKDIFKSIDKAINKNGKHISNTNK